MADKQEPKELPKELLDRISRVTNKRARLVLDAIAKNGLITTEQLQAAGYDHPPRAAQDAKDLGFSIRTIKVKHTNGKSIGAYVFDDGELDADKTGRRLLPKKERVALILAAGNKCQICRSQLNLQVDHRIPYEVAGESQVGEEEPFQILDGSCNRKKSWDCEHCQNWLVLRNLDTCRRCYWASPENYDHIAMQQERRAELVWLGHEVSSFEMLKREAERNDRTILDQIKAMLDEGIKQKP